MNSLPLSLLILVFLAAAAGVWKAGIHLSEATDGLCMRWGLGEALGGMILLAIVTNLPEVAIVASGSFRNDLSVAVGNILGGIAVQTAVLVVLDVIGLKKNGPLSRHAASPSIVLEGILVTAVLAVVIMGTQLPPSLMFARVTPAGALIVLLWIIGLWVIRKTSSKSWPEKGKGPDQSMAQCQFTGERDSAQADPTRRDTARTITVFSIGALVTLICGMVLEISSEEIARHLGISGVLFGATFLAAATALPEVSTGLAAVRLGDYQMAVSDILGGNAFLPVLFPLASLLSGQAVLPAAQKSDLYLSALGILLTAIYMTGLVFRPSRQIADMGVDSFAVLVLFVVGIAGLAAIPS